MAAHVEEQQAAFKARWLHDQVNGERETVVLYYGELRARVLASAIQHIERLFDDNAPLHIIIKPIVSELFANSDYNPEWTHYIQRNMLQLPPQLNKEHIPQRQPREDRIKPTLRHAREKRARPRTRPFKHTVWRTPNRNEVIMVEFLPFRIQNTTRITQVQTSIQKVAIRHIAFEQRIAADTKALLHKQVTRIIVVYSQNLLRKLYGVPKITEDLVRGIAYWRGDIKWDKITGAFDMFALKDNSVFSLEAILGIRALDHLQPTITLRKNIDEVRQINVFVDVLKEILVDISTESPRGIAQAAIISTTATKESLQKLINALTGTIDEMENLKQINDWNAYQRSTIALLLATETLVLLSQTTANYIRWTRQLHETILPPILVGTANKSIETPENIGMLGKRLTAYAPSFNPVLIWRTHIGFDMGNIRKEVPLFVCHGKSELFRLYIQRALAKGYRIIDVVHVHTTPELDTLTTFPEIEYVYANVDDTETDVRAIIIHRLIQLAEPPHNPETHVRKWTAWAKRTIQTLRNISLQGIVHTLEQNNIRNDDTDGRDLLRRPVFISPSLLQRLSLDVYYMRHAMKPSFQSEWLLQIPSLASIRNDWTKINWKHMRLSNNFKITSLDIPSLGLSQDIATLLAQDTIRHALDDKIDLTNGVAHHLARKIRFTRLRKFKTKVNHFILTSNAFLDLFASTPQRLEPEERPESEELEADESDEETTIDNTRLLKSVMNAMLFFLTLGGIIRRRNGMDETMDETIDKKEANTKEEEEARAKEEETTKQAMEDAKRISEARAKEEEEGKIAPTTTVPTEEARRKADEKEARRVRKAKKKRAQRNRKKDKTEKKNADEVKLRSTIAVERATSDIKRIQMFINELESLTANNDIGVIIKLANEWLAQATIVNSFALQFQNAEEAWLKDQENAQLSDAANKAHKQYQEGLGKQFTIRENIQSELEALISEPTETKQVDTELSILEQLLSFIKSFIRI